mgnify:CR=1 FL=1
MREMETDAIIENLPEVTDFAEALLDELGCPMKTMLQIDVAIDEIFTNICSYAYAPGVGKAGIKLEACEDPGGVIITFTDSGTPFDPLAAGEPDITLPAEERETGGLGVLMVRKTMDDVSYEYKDGKNVLKLLKSF